MADKTETIYVKVLTFDPALDSMIPLPDVEVFCEHDGDLYNPNLSSVYSTTDVNGIATMGITFDESDEANLNPFFTIELPVSARTVPAAAVADKQFTLPEEWITQHSAKRRISNITSYTDQAKPLEIFVGLHARLKLSYPDFDPSGIRNPIALPENVISFHLADYDTFIWDSWNPDDILEGFGFDSRPVGGNKIIPVGNSEKYPYFNEWPTVASALDGVAADPQAWIDPPLAPVGRLGRGSFEQTGILAVDVHGFVFMIDGNVIRRFYPDSTLSETIDGSSAGGFVNPAGIALDQYQNLYVADTGNDRIVIYRPKWLEGTMTGDNGFYQYHKAVGSAGGGNRQFNSPKGLVVVHERVVDKNEWLAVADSGNHRVQLFKIESTAANSNRADFPFTINLTYLNEFGKPAPAGSASAVKRVAAELWSPVDVSADRDKRLFVCDDVWHRVSRWSCSDVGIGAYIHEADWEKATGGSGNGNREFNHPVALDVDWTQNIVYVADFGNQRIQRIDANSGNHQVNWNMGLVSAPTPIGIAVDSRGEIYASDGANQCVVRGTTFDATGALKNDVDVPVRVGAEWKSQSEDGYMNKPGYCYFDDDGKLWVSDSGNNRVQIYKRNANGELVFDVMAPFADLDHPVGIVKYESGAHFVVDSNKHRIRQYDDALNFVSDFGTAGAGDNQFQNPQGVCVSRQSEPIIYIADRDNDRVKMHKLSGEYLGSISGVFAGKAMDKPEDVTVDAEGNLYIADTLQKRILHFQLTMSGTLAAPKFIQAIKPLVSSFLAPCGVSLDGERKLVVSDRDKNTVFRMENNGDVLGFWDMHAFIPQKAGSNKVYSPQLARLLLFDSPSSAVMDNKGLLVVVDTNHDQLRLIRTQTDINLNLLELGEGQPDISFRCNTNADWKSSLGLHARAGHEKTEPSDVLEYISVSKNDYSDDSYEHYHQFASGKAMHAATNALKVAHSVQRWVRHITRKDQNGHRWEDKDLDLFLFEHNNEKNLNITAYFGDDNIVLVDTDPTGLGADFWDDSVVAHEMGHWMFPKSSHPSPPFTPVGGRHQKNEITSRNLAITEGYAEYNELFWGEGCEFGRTNRIRGYAIASKGSSPLSNVWVRSTNTFVSLFGGATASPAFDDPEKGLEVEGYFANATWQIHHALFDPEILFSDSPSYWYRHNKEFSDDLSDKYCQIFRKSMRQFSNPTSPTDPRLLQGSSEYLKQMLAGAHGVSSEYAQIVQSIFELNNQLMPVITMAEVLGAPVEKTEVPIAAGKSIFIQLHDASGQPLSGYNLKIEVTGTSMNYNLLAGSGPKLRHGCQTPSAAPAGEFYRATKVDGVVELKCNASAGIKGVTEKITVTYQPDFDSDESFDPPAKGDNQETTLRKLYLYELRAASKTWAGAQTNFGAMVVAELEVKYI